MHTSRKQDSAKAEAEESKAKIWSEWFARLTNVAKRAVLRRRARAELRAQLRANPAPATSGYQCPKCWSWHATPAARRSCRISHHQVEAT